MEVEEDLSTMAAVCWAEGRWWGRLEKATEGVEAPDL